MSNAPVNIGTVRQLFVDENLIDSIRDARLVLHRPEMRNRAITLDHPWESGGVAYAVIFKDGEKYRMWYRCSPFEGSKVGQGCMTAYAESENGIRWNKPSLGVIEYQGSRDNNLVLDERELTNFAPFIDLNPDTPADERYKGIGRHGGVYTATSADGIHWTRKNLKPVQTDGPFDSHNIAFHDPWTGKYVMYTRGVKTDGSAGHGANKNFKEGVRWIRRAESEDFVNWTPLEPIDTGDEPIEHLYTNSCVPYERSPGLYLMFPSRFVDGRSPTPDWPYPGVNDGVFMTSRDGIRFDRTFKEAFVRPGPDPENWHERSIYVMRGILETGPAQLSMYITEHWRTKTNCVRRMTLRTDGFVSVQAPYDGGEMITRALVFEGDELRINLSTSAAGMARIELQDENGSPIPGFGLEDCQEVFQDQIDLPVRWNSGADLSSLVGTPVRLRFILEDADLYAFRFVNKKEDGA